MKKQMLLLLTMLCALLAGCSRQEASPANATVPTTQVQTSPPTQAPTVPTLSPAPAPALPVPGQSTIGDVVLYYQEAYPGRDLYANFLDLDGNGWGDLAVWDQGCYLCICFMEEDYVLSRLVGFETIANLYEYWYPGENGMECQPNILGTYELKDNDTVSIDTFYDISQGGILTLRESLKCDRSSGDAKWFTIGDDDWVPISQETYEERLSRYHYSAENLNPIGDYYFR